VPRVKARSAQGKTIEVFQEGINTRKRRVMSDLRREVRENPLGTLWCRLVPPGAAYFLIVFFENGEAAAGRSGWFSGCLRFENRLMSVVPYGAWKVIGVSSSHPVAG
jgi:hypothetical protein